MFADAIDVVERRQQRGQHVDDAMLAETLLLALRTIAVVDELGAFTLQRFEIVGGFLLGLAQRGQRVVGGRSVIRTRGSGVTGLIGRARFGGRLVPSRAGSALISRRIRRLGRVRRLAGRTGGSAVGKAGLPGADRLSASGRSSGIVLLTRT